MREFSLTKHVLISLVNDIPKVFVSADNTFDPYLVVSRALKSLTGNQIKKQNIIKEAYDPAQMQKVYQAYGILGVRYNTHAAFNRHKIFDPLDLEDSISPGDEIVLIRNDILDRFNKEIISKFLSVHRIIPDRVNRPCD